VRFSVPVRAALIALPLLGLTGCGVVHIFDPTVRQRGSRVDPDALKELIPGTSSRADVQALIGSPTTIPGSISASSPAPASAARPACGNRTW
jgi:outer membrane protein assembly factor BamE (lipoprotein component of BamABCDE complex)